MNAQTQKDQLDKLKALPPAQIAEVEISADFVKAREEPTHDDAIRRLGEAFAKYTLQAETDAARPEHRARADCR